MTSSVRLSLDADVVLDVVEKWGYAGKTRGKVGPGEEETRMESGVWANLSRIAWLANAVVM